MSRRELLRRGAVIGGTLVWATPVVQTITPPAFAGSPKDFSYVAVCYSCDGGATVLCVKFDLDDDGAPMACEADKFQTPGCTGFSPPGTIGADCELLRVRSPDSGSTVHVSLAEAAPPGCVIVEGRSVGKCGDPPGTGECAPGLLSPDKRMITFEMCGL